MNTNWKKYIQQTATLKPRPLTIEGLSYVKNKNQALDLGAGALNDTRFLIREGFHVIILDNEPGVSDIAKQLPEEKIGLVIAPFSEYEFPNETFDFITAQFSLPFQSKEDFFKVFPKIIRSLKKDGVVAFNLFGDKDDWNKQAFKDRFFIEKIELEKLLREANVIVIKDEESEWNGKTAAGDIKHWHTFEVIVKK